MIDGIHYYVIINAVDIMPRHQLLCQVVNIGRRKIIMTKTNIRIRVAMLESGLRQWEVAEALGMAEESLCRKMRKELPEAEQEKILGSIASLRERG
jgi:predicted XRE-type DNA-binding protein